MLGGLGRPAAPAAALESCRLSSPEAATSVAAECLSLTVPEDHGSPGGRQISPRVAVVPAVSQGAPARRGPLCALFQPHDAGGGRPLRPGRLGAYGDQLGALRLQARGVSPSLVTPLAVELVDTATAQSRAAGLLNILPYFLIFAVFVGGVGLTIDMTAGERERGSLEPLLLNSLGRGELVLGKLAAALVPTLLSVLVALAGFAAVINISPWTGSSA